MIHFETEISFVCLFPLCGCSLRCATQGELSNLKIIQLRIQILFKHQFHSVIESLEMEGAFEGHQVQQIFLSCKRLNKKILKTQYFKECVLKLPFASFLPRSTVLHCRNRYLCSSLV